MQIGHYVVCDTVCMNSSDTSDELETMETYMIHDVDTR